VVIDEVDVVRIATLEMENDSPVGSNRHSIIALETALEWMDSQRWEIQKGWFSCHIQQAKDVFDPIDHFGRQFTAVIMFVEAL
jgi:hypothetical protein